MVLFREFRAPGARRAACAGCRRRRAALRAAWRRLFRRRTDRGGEGGGNGPAPDFSRYFLVVEHIDTAGGTVTFRLNDRHEEGYRLGLKIPLDWQGRPVDPDLLIEAMVAGIVPTVRRELAGSGPPDYSRLAPLQGRRIAIAHSIQRHYRCEDCRYG